MFWPSMKRGTCLAQRYPDTAQLVKLYCFAGLSIPRAAQMPGLSSRTVYRDWAFAWVALS
jgi:hypothetical protein